MFCAPPVARCAPTKTNRVRAHPIPTLTPPPPPRRNPRSPHIAGVVAKCFAVGVCTSAPQAVDAVAAAARARNIADASYGYRLDPFFARSRVGVDRYYGPLVHAGWRPAA